MLFIKPTNAKISLTHLYSRVKQTIIAIASVVFGISMYIFMNSFMHGVNDVQAELAFSTLAHIRVYNGQPDDNTNLLASYHPDAAIHIRNPKVIKYTEGILNSEEIIQVLEKQPEVVAITPQVNTNVFYQNGATKANGNLFGVDVIKENELFGTSEFVIEGKWEDLLRESNGLIMGVGLADNLSLRVGNTVQVITADGVSKNYKVIGLIKTTLAGIDNARAFTSLLSVRQLLSKNAGYASDIQININNFEQAAEIADFYSTFLSYEVESWNQSNGQLEASNDLRNIIAIAVSLTILIVAGFGIYNIMNMTVNEKLKDIAILKAVGFDGNDIIQIFLMQSIIIGIIGGILGTVFGFIVSFTVNKIPFEIASLTHLPMSYNSIDYLMAFGFGLITTYVAGYMPAKKASKIDPIEIIRA